LPAYSAGKQSPCLPVGRANAQNNVLTDVILKAKPEGSLGFQYCATIITVRGILPCLPTGRADVQNDIFTDVILRAKPLPTGRQAKDPSAFSNNQQSLLWMGFFISFRMTAKLTWNSSLPA